MCDPLQSAELSTMEYNTNGKELKTIRTINDGNIVVVVVCTCVCLCVCAWGKQQLRIHVHERGRKKKGKISELRPLKDSNPQNPQTHACAATVLSPALLLIARLFSHLCYLIIVKMHALFWILAACDCWWQRFLSKSVLWFAPDQWLQMSLVLPISI